MGRLENDQFLTKLTELFQKSKTGGSVFINMKKYDGKKSSTKDAATHATPEKYCLIRASLSSTKISTMVSQKDLNKFQQAFANVLKGNIDGLKREKKAESSSNRRLKASKA